MRELYRSHDGVGLAGLVRSGEVAASELLETALALAEEHNDLLNAITVWDVERARETAAGFLDGPFRGVPFLLKDLFSPMAGLASTDGTGLYVGATPTYDAELVRRFKAAGLVIFGRTASPEFGLTTTTESVRHGPTRNPWSPEYSAGGSSGGAAAMVAVGAVPLAHASDGGGSIRIPASNCGIFGMKPSRARISSGPDIGEGWSGMSTPGCVSRSVRDSAALLDVVSGPAPGDPYIAPPPRRPYLEEVERDPGRLRVGLVTHPFFDCEVDIECLDAVRAAGLLCERLGHDVQSLLIDVGDDPEAIRSIVAVHTLRLLEDVGHLRGSPVREGEVEAVTWALAELGRQVDATAFVRATDQIHLLGRRVAAAMQGFDVLVSPMMATPPPLLGTISMDRLDDDATAVLYRTLAFGQLMNATGMPAMSVPLHWSSVGLPIGTQFAAPMGREDVLFRLAGQLERAQPWADRWPGSG